MYKVGEELVLNDKEAAFHSGCSNLDDAFYEKRAVCIRLTHNQGEDDRSVPFWEALDKDGQAILVNCCSIDLKYFRRRGGSKMSSMSRYTLTESQKKNLSPNAQALVEAGYYDSNLRVRNTQHFMDFLVEKFEDDYAAKAKAELEADDIANGKTTNGKKK